MRNSIVILFLCVASLMYSQQKDPKVLEREARKDVREGNELYNQLKFEEAEIAYKKALDKNPNYAKASYNLGNAIYQKNKNKEAIFQYDLAEKIAPDKMSKAEIFHNEGNAFMKEKQYDKAVQAYKNSLRNNSKDDETRYNLAMAQKLLKEQQNKDKKDDNKDKNQKDKNKDKDKEGGDKDKKNEKDKNQDKGKDKEDDKGDPKKDKDNQQNKDQKPRPNELSPEQMKQLLEAMNNEENKTQKKLNAQKARGQKIKNEKDW